MIVQYFKKKENEYKVQADLIYLKMLEDSKLLLKKNFFKEINFDSTFEIMSILLIFNIKSFKKKNINHHKNTNEHLMNNFVNDLDLSIREFGIGDMSIGKYVKKYVKKFYYRVKILDPILEKHDNFDEFLQFLASLKLINRNNLKIMCDELLSKFAELKK